MYGSLYAIESAQMAIESYNALSKDDIERIGEKPIIYGLFQALYIQQDSVLNLCKSIGIPIPNDDDTFKTQYPDLYKIKNLRNKGIGHPTPKPQDKKLKSTHSMLIIKDSIKLFTYTKTGEFCSNTYKISDCVEKQDKSLCIFMKQVIEKMKLIYQNHKDEYKQAKLKDYFPVVPQDCIIKIFEAINLIEDQHPNETKSQRIGREDRISIAFRYSKALIEAIKNFEAEYNKRGLQYTNADCVNSELKNSKYPLEKLKEYFSFPPKTKSSLNPQDARAYADSAQEHISELIKSAERLDKIYINTS